MDTFKDKIVINIRKLFLSAGLHQRYNPHFIIIGAQKSGTTSLFKYINSFSLNFIDPYRKEIHYFDKNYHKSINWYKSFFPKFDGENQNYLTGEATPYYIFHPAVPERTYQHNPDIKLVVMLRNPVTRAYSHYQFQNKNQALKITDPLPFNKAIEREEKRLNGEKNKLLSDPKYRSLNYQYYSYLNRGIYHRQLKRWFSYFEQDQFYFIQSEKFFEDPARVLDDLFEWLGLEGKDMHGLNPSNYNRTNYEPLDEKTKEKLQNFYRPHNKELERLLGIKFDWGY